MQEGCRSVLTYMFAMQKSVLPTLSLIFRPSVDKIFSASQKNILRFGSEHCIFDRHNLVKNETNFVKLNQLQKLCEILGSLVLLSGKNSNFLCAVSWKSRSNLDVRPPTFYLATFCITQPNFRPVGNTAKSLDICSHVQLELLKGISFNKPNQFYFSQWPVCSVAAQRYNMQNVHSTCICRRKSCIKLQKSFLCQFITFACYFLVQCDHTAAQPGV